MRSLSLHPHRDAILAARATEEAKSPRTPRPPDRPYPGCAAAVLAEINVVPVPPVRIVLAPVGRIRLDQLKRRRLEQTPVSQLCAAAGLTYAERHIPRQVRTLTAFADAVKGC